MILRETTHTPDIEPPTAIAMTIVPAEADYVYKAELL
jgi:hypothetical protein